jgi:dihydroneopterin aldolase
MSGIIGFKGLAVSCVIGTEPHERMHEQELIIDLKVEADLSKVVASGRLEDTINYVSLAQICKEMAVKGRYLLIEKFAADVLQEISEQFPAKSVWIRVKKPLAISAAECAFVELTL